MGCDLWKQGPSSIKEVLPGSRRAPLGGRNFAIIMHCLLPFILMGRVQGHLLAHPHGCGHGGLSSRRHHLFGGRGWRSRACHLGSPFFELLAVSGPSKKPQSKTDKREKERNQRRERQRDIETIMGSCSCFSIARISSSSSNFTCCCNTAACPTSKVPVLHARLGSFVASAMIRADHCWSQKTGPSC